MITLFYIHKKPHQFIINVSIIAHPYPSSLQINSNCIMYGVSRYYADVKKTIIFSSNFLTFVISFPGTHSYFLAHNFQHYLKVLGVSAKEHPISSDISSREHTYLNNDFLNKKHIDGK